MTRRSKQLVKQDYKPGIIGWIRRRVLPILAKGTALLGILMIGAWITGRVLTDEHHWSQYLYWLPPIVMIGGAWVMLFLSTILAALARRLGGLILRPVLLVIAIGCTIHLVFGVWHLHRAPFADRSKNPDTIRVGHWNLAGQEQDTKAIGETFNALDVDIALLANVQWGEPRQEVLEHFEHFAPDERVRWVNYSHKLNADPAHFRVEGDAIIASRFPMTRTGLVRFGSRERQQVLHHSSSESGWVMFAVFDVDTERTDDPPFVVWFVDLPSNPTSWKMDSMREVRQYVDAWDGAGWEMGRHVWERAISDKESFPDPDLIVGDFNTPRGSASIDQLMPSFNDAFESAGHGRGRSFAIEDGSWSENMMFKVLDMHIDLTLVAPTHSPTGYALIHMDDADHAIQVADIVLGTK